MTIEELLEKPYWIIDILPKQVPYNIHYQMNPENVTKTGHDYAAVLKKKIDVMEY